MNENSPLVSVVIITYNSQDTIIETLESVKAQTYKNIELIVSDDYSKDQTVNLVRKWFENNSNRFVRIKLVESSINTGVSANANRGNHEARGEWLKTLAGDDTFEPDAIEEYVKFCMENQCVACFAKMKTFGIDEEANKRNTLVLNKMYNDLRLPTREAQYKAALVRHIMPGPGTFFRRDFVEEIGGFNEKYPIMEEYDFELRILDKTKFYFLDKYLINWRIRPDSLCHSGNKQLQDDGNAFALDVRIPRMLKAKMYLSAWDCYLSLIIFRKRNNSSYPFYKLLLLTSPIYLLSRLRRSFHFK